MTYINRVNTGGKVSWTAQSLNAMIDSVNHRKRTGLHRIAPHFSRQASVVSAYYVSGFGEKTEFPIKAGTALDLLPYSDYTGLVAVTKHDPLIDRGSTLPFVICVNDVDDENAVFNVAVDGPIPVTIAGDNSYGERGYAFPSDTDPSVFYIEPYSDGVIHRFPPVLSRCGNVATILLGGASTLEENEQPEEDDDDEIAKQNIPFYLYVTTKSTTEPVVMFTGGKYELITMASKKTIFAEEKLNPLPGITSALTYKTVDYMANLNIQRGGFGGHFWDSSDIPDGYNHVCLTFYVDGFSTSSKPNWVFMPVSLEKELTPIEQGATHSRIPFGGIYKTKDQRTGKVFVKVYDYNCRFPRFIVESPNLYDGLTNTSGQQTNYPSVPI